MHTEVYKGKMIVSGDLFPSFTDEEQRKYR